MTKVNPRLITLFLATAATDRSDEVSEFHIKSAASGPDFLTFTAARMGGGRDYTMEGTVAQDHAVGTLWDTIWTAPGTEVLGKYAPYGNAVATVAQPHYTFTAIVAEPDGDLMGGKSTISTTAVATIDIKWALKSKPVKVTA